MKKCKKCKQEKDKYEFSRKMGNVDNLNHICKQCINEVDRQRRISKKFDKQFELI